MKTRFNSPIFWGSLMLVLAQIFALSLAIVARVFVESAGITSPDVSAGVPIIYFFVAVAVIGTILAVVPLSVLKIILQILLALLFAWGTFVILGLILPIITAIVIATGVGLAWYFKPKVWLHDLALFIALISVGVVFGFFVSPWTAIIVMAVIAIYDFLAVYFGYMLWMAKKLSASQAIPAFIFPRKLADWNLDLKKSGFDKIFESEVAERDFSILGGGDIGFSLLLAVSVFFAHDLVPAMIVALFSVFGLITAYGIQVLFAKGKAVPALPPITILSVIGLLIVINFVI